ncbi:MAG: hypothetical protein M1830_003808 [Pleopsidium flavum]|nr:MAG: hypothetical protein M1830_003808 [Pleopsidium flavum]
MAAMDDMEFSHIDAFDNSIASLKSGSTLTVKKPRPGGAFGFQDVKQEDDLQEPRQLESGLDNPPKTSTKLIATLSKTQRPQAKQVTAASRGKASSTLPVMPTGQSKNRKAANIEIVNLAGEGQCGEVSKVMPQEYLNLHRSHDSVQKAAPIGLLSPKRSKFSYGKVTRPNLSFLSEPHDTVRYLEDTPSEYDNNWMDDLPSPSALIGKKASAVNSSPPRLPQENGGAKYEDSMSELEACMVGLDDSLALGHGKVDRATDVRLYALNDDGSNDKLNRDLATKWSSSPVRNKHAGHLQFIHGRGVDPHRARSKGQLIFMSTDSPEKPGTPSFAVGSHGKRTVETSIGSERLSEGFPPAKKRRTSVDYGDQARQPVASLRDGRNTSQEKPAENAQRPGWEGIDPDLIAEYGDIVEFVEFI